MNERRKKKKTYRYSHILTTINVSAILDSARPDRTRDKERYFSVILANPTASAAAAACPATRSQALPVSPLPNPRPETETRYVFCLLEPRAPPRPLESNLVGWLPRGRGYPLGGNP